MEDRLTVDDILVPLTSDQIKAKLLGYLANANLPTTDWFPGAFIRTLMSIHGTSALLDIQKAETAIAENGFPSEAEDDNLTVLAVQLFNVRRNFNLTTGVQFGGTFTQQAVVLTGAGGVSSHAVTAGSLWVRSRVTGNRYVSITSGTIPASGSVTVTFQAEHPNDSANGSNYADGPGTLTVLETLWPGVTANNVAPNFSGVTKVAVGLGVFTVNGTPSAAPTAYDVAITLSGQVGTAIFHYRENGGVWSSTQVTAASFTIPSGPTIHFANDGGGANPSFIAGDVYSFTSPGTPITQQGLDPETDAALLTRCYARWGDLTAAPTVDKHVTWAMAADPLITRVKLAIDATYPGRLLVTIAGVSNPLSGGIVTAAQLYIDQREAIGDLSLVAAATVTLVTATATVTVPALRLVQIQNDAQVLWNSYIGAIDLGGTVRAAIFEQIVKDLGAIDVTGLQLNGSPGNLVLATNAVGAPDDIITAHVIWVAV
jgi:hypothetical protein